MSRILVTGGAGFIGSHVADELLGRGHRVVVLDNLSTGSVDYVPPAARLIVEDICEYGRVVDFMERHSFDYVYHLAASTAPDALYRARHLNYANNLLGSLNLISASIQTGVQCIFFASSTTVYGRSATGTAREDITPAHPEDSHSIAKLAVEQELELAHRTFGLDHVIFRVHHICGERQRLDDVQDNPVGRLLVQAFLGRSITVTDDGKQIVSFAYVRDVASSLADAIEIPTARNQIFNIGSDHSTSEGTLATAVAGAMGLEAQVTSELSLERPPALRISQEKLESVFGRPPKCDTTEMMAALAAWARAQDAARWNEADLATAGARIAQAGRSQR